MFNTQQWRQRNLNNYDSRAFHNDIHFFFLFNKYLLFIIRAGVFIEKSTLFRKKKLLYIIHNQYRLGNFLQKTVLTVVNSPSLTADPKAGVNMICMVSPAAIVTYLNIERRILQKNQSTTVQPYAAWNYQVRRVCCSPRTAYQTVGKSHEVSGVGRLKIF